MEIYFLFIFFMSDIEKSTINSEIEESDYKDENIQILLLSKDLINQLDSLDDDELDKIKKDEKNINDIKNYFHSSESSNDEEPEIKKKDKNHNLNNDSLKSNNKDNTTNINNNEIQNNNEKFQSKLYNSILLYEINKQNPQENKNNNNNYNGKGSEEEKQLFINQNNSYNLYINNYNNCNQINFIRSCFTRNGKPGWICSYCKNFNYESKYIY